MKIFRFTFNTDGTVEKETIKVRKNKNDYAFDEYNTTFGGTYINHVDFDKMGKVICGSSEAAKRPGIMCTMYLKTDTEITQEMLLFAKKRAEKIKELQNTRKQMYQEIQQLCDEFELKVQ